MMRYRLRASRMSAVMLCAALLAVPVASIVPASAVPLATAGSLKAAAGDCPAAGGVAVPEAPLAATGALIASGHGWGHSLGMSQYGALGAARLGCPASTILSTYYPGTTLAQQALRPTVALRLLNTEVAGRSTIEAQIGTLTWAARTANGTTVTVAQPVGEKWLVQRRADGRGVTLTDAVGAQRFWVDDGGALVLQERGSVARVRSFGGVAGTTLRTDLRVRWDDTRFTASKAGLAVEQVLHDDASGTGVQKYLWGLAEVPASWPSAALQAQAIAARTYLVAGYADAVDPTLYRIGTTTATQHYGGYAHELDDQAGGGAWQAAVDATDRQLVVGADGTPINAFYTSSHGGRSEDIQYVWGYPAVPYLQPIDDSRWDAASDNPFRSWSVGLAQADVARRFGFDTVLDVRVAAAGTPERLAGVSVTGVTAGVTTTRTLTGAATRTALGLRSPSFSLRWLVPQTSQPIAGDFDGDGRGDVGWFAGGRVSLLTASGARRVYLLGGPGDRAVVGDWDGNGRDSVGVVSGITWCLRNLVTTGPCDITFRYGAPTDVPVAGRWRGGKVDGIGVWRAGRWLLRDTPSGGSSQLNIGWGRVGDVPVVGDWDGNGTDTQGIVRDHKWFVSNILRNKSPHAAAFVYGRSTERFVTGAWAGKRRSFPATVLGSVFFQRAALSGGPVTRRVKLDP